MTKSEDDIESAIVHMVELQCQEELSNCQTVSMGYDVFHSSRGIEVRVAKGQILNCCGIIIGPEEIEIYTRTLVAADEMRKNKLWFLRWFFPKEKPDFYKRQLHVKRSDWVSKGVPFFQNKFKQLLSQTKEK